MYSSTFHTAWCFDNKNLFVFPHVACNVLSVLNKLVKLVFQTNYIH